MQEIYFIASLTGYINKGHWIGLTFVSLLHLFTEFTPYFKNLRLVALFTQYLSRLFLVAVSQNVMLSYSCSFLCRSICTLVRWMFVLSMPISNGLMKIYA